LLVRRKFATLAFPLALIACAPSTPSFVAALPSTQSVMSYYECKEAQTCTISGHLTVIESDGVSMGELALEDGKCVTLSLSPNDIRFVRRVGSVAATISGRVYRGHHDPNYILLEIEGRRVGYPRCGDFYVFVP
jgi:hypothetical protein